MFYAHDALAALLETKDAKNPEETSCIFELEAALRYLRQDLESTFTSLSNLLPNQQITYPGLGAIFPPNTIIYGTDQLQNPRAWRVRSVFEQEDNKGNQWLQIEPEHIDYDGDNVGTVRSESLSISAFPGARNISELPYLPIEYAPDPAAVRKNLLEMGRKAMRLHGRRLVEYKGHALKEVPPPRDITKFNVRNTAKFLNDCIVMSFSPRHRDG